MESCPSSYELYAKDKFVRVFRARTKCGTEKKMVVLRSSAARQRSQEIRLPWTAKSD